MKAKAYLLDANVIFHLANKAAGWELIAKKLIEIPPRRMLLSSIGAFELGIKIHLGPGKIKLTSLRQATAYLERFKVLPFTEKASPMAALIEGQLMAAGKGIGWRDAMISGIALVHDLVVVTDNVNEFRRVPTLEVENWRRPGT